MDIGGWLRSLSLEEYETAFRENKVDAAVLPKLTAEDLKDLGVAAVGDRRKLLEAIEVLRCGPSPAAFTAKDTAAERRQVTVMFSDLVGSTALSARRTLKTSARSFRLIRSVLPRPCSASAVSLQNIWVTAYWSTSGIPKPTKTMQSEPCAQGWSWRRLWLA